MKYYLMLVTIPILFSSCLKQSIADAMLNTNKQGKITATMSYEINGNPVTITVQDADHQVAGYRNLSCEKSAGYLLSGVGSYGEIVFTFYTDSLKVGNYRFSRTDGIIYVTSFGYPDYVAGPTDYMDFNVTTYKDGHISGNFTGQLTPAVMQGYPNNVYGTSGSVLIKNGSFNNVPVFY